MAERKTLIDVIDGFDVAMLLTGLSTSANGRPMSIAGHDEGDLWFIAARDSLVAREVDGDARAMVTLQSARDYALVRGTARLVDDRDKLRALWSTAADLYFPKGPDGGEAVLVRFSPTEGQYWDMHRGRERGQGAQAWRAGEPIANTRPRQDLTEV